LLEVEGGEEQEVGEEEEGQVKLEFLKGLHESINYSGFNCNY